MDRIQSTRYPAQQSAVHDIRQTRILIAFTVLSSSRITPLGRLNHACPHILPNYFRVHSPLVHIPTLAICRRHITHITEAARTKALHAREIGSIEGLDAALKPKMGVILQHFHTPGHADHFDAVLCASPFLPAVTCLSTRSTIPFRRSDHM